MPQFLSYELHSTKVFPWVNSRISGFRLNFASNHSHKCFVLEQTFYSAWIVTLAHSFINIITFGITDYYLNRCNKITHISAQDLFIFIGYIHTICTQQYHSLIYIKQCIRQSLLKSLEYKLLKLSRIWKVPNWIYCKYHNDWKNLLCSGNKCRIYFRI